MPTLPFNIEALLSGADLYKVTNDTEFAHNLRPEIVPMPDSVRGKIARFTGYRAAVYLTVVVEEGGDPMYHQWRNEALGDGTLDDRVCPSYGFCSGGDAAQKGQPGGPTTVTFVVAGVKDAGSVTVRIGVVNIANPNHIDVLRALSKLVNDRLLK